MARRRQRWRQLQSALSSCRQRAQPGVSGKHDELCLSPHTGDVSARLLIVSGNGAEHSRAEYRSP